MKARLEEIGEHCAQIGRDIQSLSHQLHSSKLDYLGLVAAVRSYCNELAKQHHVLIGFREQNIPPELPRNLSLCLFRLVQEALHNAIKYSGTHEFTVQLNGSSKEIELIVTDKGKGFDVQESSQNAGLGLISMQERVRLVQGRFSIQSQLGEGTMVMASVPLGADSPLIEPQLAELQSNPRQ
jgi:signal transduction histidine kinase